MFSVFESFFRASLEREERPPGIAKVGVFTRRRLLYDCSAHACGPDEPGGDPRGPGGEAQWPGGGYTAWTERATKSPAWEKGPPWASKMAVTAHPGVTYGYLVHQKALEQTQKLPPQAQILPLMVALTTALSP
jgi:hypothetical protein